MRPIRMKESDCLTRRKLRAIHVGCFIQERLNLVTTPVAAKDGVSYGRPRMITRIAFRGITSRGRMFINAFVRFSNCEVAVRLVEGDHMFRRCKPPDWRKMIGFKRQAELSDEVFPL